MKSVPVVTVALPVRNGGEVLKLAILSIVRQSFANWELLLIDDGSTDGATEVLSKIDPRITLVKWRETRGIAARLNEAIHAARGRYFARMDHDDISHPDRLRSQVEYLERHPEIDLLGTRCVTFSERGLVTGSLPSPTVHEDICAYPWMGFHLAHPSWMGRSSWFAKNLYLYPAPFRCEDQELLLRTYSQSHFAALSKALLGYRVRAGSDLPVLIRTRLALAGVQAKHFWARGPRTWSASSYSAALVRIQMDVIRHFLGGSAPARTAATNEEIAEWTAIIASVKEEGARVAALQTNGGH